MTNIISSTMERIKDFLENKCENGNNKRFSGQWTQGPQCFKKVLKWLKTIYRIITMVHNG
jgi:hypothetical protein